MTAGLGVRFHPAVSSFTIALSCAHRPPGFVAQKEGGRITGNDAWTRRGGVLPGRHGPTGPSTTRGQGKHL